LVSHRAAATRGCPSRSTADKYPLPRSRGARVLSRHRRAVRANASSTNGPLLFSADLRALGRAVPQLPDFGRSCLNLLSNASLRVSRKATAPWVRTPVHVYDDVGCASPSATSAAGGLHRAGSRIRSLLHFTTKGSVKGNRPFFIYSRGGIAESPRRRLSVLDPVAASQRRSSSRSPRALWPCGGACGCGSTSTAG